MKNYTVLAVVFTLISGASTQVFAQTAPTRSLPGVVDKQDTRISEKTKTKKSVSVKKPELKKEAVKNPEARVAAFRSFNFRGNTVIPSEELSAALTKYINRPLNNADLSNIKFDITKYYTEEGYNLVKVVTPPQNVSAGVLNIEIVEAAIEDVIVNDPKNLIKPSLASAIKQRIQGGEIFNDMEAESLASDFDELENVSANVSLRPGEGFRTTDVMVNIDEANDEVNYARVDNYGSDLTGRNVATLHYEKENLANLGESVFTNLRISDGSMWSGEIGTKIPVFYRNLNLEASYQHSANEIEGRLRALNAEGTSDQVNLALASDIINRLNRQVTLRGGFEARNHGSEVLGAKDSSDSIRQLYAEASWLERMDDLTTYVSARLIKGINILGASDKGDFFNSRLQAEPEAIIFRPAASVSYRTDILPYDSIIRLNTNAQITNNVVLASDMFTAGGYGSVRGFELAQESGDEGYGLSIEYMVDVPIDDEWQFEAGPFYDLAHVSNDLAGVSVDDTLKSTGLAFEANTESLISSGKTVLRFDFAHTLGDYNDGTIDSDRFYFQIAQDF